MRSLKVLIAESDPLLQKLYSDVILNDTSFTLLKRVDTGPQMFEAMRCVDVDLVLLDLYLKEFSAFDEIDELRKEFPRTDYIVVSSGDNPELVRKAICAGVFEFLVKPFSFDRLRAALRGEGVSYPFVTRRDSVRALIRCALATRSDICIIPVQDILGLDNSSRMNVPGTPSGNWQFRLAEIPGRQQAAIFRAAVRASGRL